MTAVRPREVPRMIGRFVVTLFAFAVLCGVACAQMRDRFVLVAPDYAKPDAWAAYPGQPSNADASPDGVAPGRRGDVAVFFVHPTTYLAMRIANAPYNAGGAVGAGVDDAVMKYQASIFRDAGPLYAPRYRQASLKSITTDSQAAFDSDEIAYGDVARAFDAFVARLGDRRFILAGHSQGSIHALRLLQQKIAGTPLQHRMVAAYLAGVSLPADIGKTGVPVCDAPAQTGCVVSWNSVRDGYRDERRLNDAVIWWQGRYQPIAGRPIVCVNPLDWRENSSAPASANLGAVGRADGSGEIPAPIPAGVGAACQSGLLGVDISDAAEPHFHDLLSLTGVYHDFDFGLFYMNVRRNVATRIGS